MSKNKQIVPQSGTPLERLGLPMDEVRDLLGLIGAGSFGRQVGSQFKRQMAHEVVGGIFTLIRIVGMLAVIGIIVTIAIVFAPHIPAPETASDTTAAVTPTPRQWQLKPLEGQQPTPQPTATAEVTPAPAEDIKPPAWARVTLYYDWHSGHYLRTREHPDDLQQYFGEEQAREILRKQGN